jgi:exosortase
VTTVPSTLRPLAPPRVEPAIGWLGISMRAWWMAGLLLACFVGLYHQSLVRLWIKTNPFNGSDEWAHAMFVPVIGLYYLYLNLDELKRARVKPLLGLDFYAGRFLAAGLAVGGGLVLWFGLASLGGVFAQYAPEITALGKGLVIFGTLAAVLDWGLGTLLAGLFMYGYGIWPGSNDFLRDFGMVTSVFGIVLTLCGWQVMRIAWFPCVFLACMLPWPGLLYSKLAMPMQELSAHVGVITMQVFGVNVEKIGTTMLMHRPDGRGDRPLDVAEACAGLKSLMTFVSLGAAVAFLSPRPLWQRLIITFSAVPIAILCNALRVSGQGLLDYYVDESWSTGFAHQFAGLVMLLPGFLLLMGVVWMLDQLFVDVDEEEPAKPSSPAKPHAAIGGAQ